MNGNLYMIPVELGENNLNDIIPPNVAKMLNTIDFYISENIRTSRRYLSKVGIEKPINQLTFFELNKHTDATQLKTYLQPALEGKHVGLMSEAGCPGVADPGAAIATIAHQLDIRVVPLTGPSSILLSLMASGMNGQSFAFVGYLPIQKTDRMRKIKWLESKSKQENQTQIFIETPFRNMALLDDLLAACQPNTQLCVAVDITLPTEYIKTKTIKEWRGQLPQIHKRTATFLLYSV